MSTSVESWLKTTWLSQGPPVCVLEGGSGVGKSRLLGQFLTDVQLPHVRINATGGSLGLDDTLLELALALESIDVDTMSRRDDGDLVAGLGEALQQEVLVAIDDFDELVNPRTGLPPTELLRLLREVSAKGTKGRLLIVSGLNLAEGAWQERIAFRTILPPAESDATEFLGTLLRDRGRLKEIPEDQQVEVVRWLGGNPRALEAFVACLQFYSIEEIIELEQDAWGIRDQVVSPALIRQLEERFTSRTLSKLQPATLLLLQFLSVYRKSFTREAIDRLPAELRGHETELLTRFLMTRDRRWFGLSRYAREIARAQIEQTVSRKQFESAHSLAADHFVRHFRTVNYPDAVKHGSEFVEARFHLSRCGREEEFSDLARVMRSSLLVASIPTKRKLPSGEADRNHLIMCLGAALSIDNSPYVEARSLLARLLVARNERDDKLRALQQVTIASRNSNDQTVWMLRVKLASEVDTLVSFHAAADQALATVPEGSRASFFYQIAKIHAIAGRMEEAFDVVARGIEDASVNNPTGLADLYTLQAALQARQAHYRDAVNTLIRFIADPQFEQRVPLMFQHRTYERAVLVAFAAQQRDLLERLLTLLSTRQAARSQFILCKIAILQSADRYDEVELVEQGGSFRTAEVGQRAFSYLCAGKPRAALDLMAKEYELKGVQGWLWALAAYCNGQQDLAAVAITEFTGNTTAPGEVNPALLIKLWHDIGEGFDKNVAFWHPRLPRGLTGLPRDLVRLQTPVAELDYSLISRAVFPVTPMSDGEVMTVRSSGSSKQAVDELVPSDADDRPSIMVAPVIQVQTHGGTMAGDGPKYNFSGPVGAAGDNAVASNFVQTYQQLDGSGLRLELTRVRDAMRAEARTADQDDAVAAVSRAEIAIAAGDVQSAESNLARGGRWALSTATAIGAGVAAAAIKAAIGL